MGMFDSLYDSAGNEWQTKAFYCGLNRFEIGDEMPVPPIACQVEVLGGEMDQEATDSFATFRDGLLAAVPSERDETLPLMNYSGVWISKGNPNQAVTA